jgi:hypothetical protein
MIVATTKVENFDRFLKIFSTKGAEKRRQHGARTDPARWTSDDRRPRAARSGGAVERSGSSGAADSAASRLSVGVRSLVPRLDESASARVRRPHLLDKVALRPPRDG